MNTFSEATAAWLEAQSEAARLGTREAAERAEEALQALREHPSVLHARRTHGRGVVGARDGIED